MSRFAGLDPSQEDHRAILDDLQMGIIKGHGRQFSSYVLLRFREGDPADVRRFVKSLPRGSALEQIQNKRLKASGITSQFHYSVSLSATGFKKLAVPSSDSPADLSFIRGMRWSSKNTMKDYVEADWIGFFLNEVDALFVVANDDKSKVDETIANLRNWQKTILPQTDVYVIEAAGRRDEGGNETEHFGFADGISQPLFLKSDIDIYLSQNDAVINDLTFDPRDLVLVAYNSGDSAFGSLLALRIIKQDTERFQELMDAMSIASGIDKGLLEAQVVGRHRDGTPLELKAAPSGDYPPNNNFNHLSDTRGARCPLHAHTRKMNQRDGDETAAYHAIARRGVLYDKLADGEERGLLFMCYQADIGRQFEFLQSKWASDPAFPGTSMPGVDPLLKHSAPGTPQKWNRSWDSIERRYAAGLAAITKFRGGEYFFTPPNSFFGQL